MNNKQIIRECIKRVILESEIKSELEQLFDYLSQDDHSTLISKDNRPDLDQKAYNYFEPNGIVQTEWAIHFTYLEAYEEIYSKGFKGYISDFDKLAYTGRYHNYDGKMSKNNWNFALPIDNEYLGDDRGYGDCGFIIKTSGVRAYHKIDKDDEIIFKNKYVSKKNTFYV